MSSPVVRVSCAVVIVVTVSLCVRDIWPPPPPSSNVNVWVSFDYKRLNKLCINLNTHILCYCPFINSRLLFILSQLLDLWLRVNASGGGSTQLSNWIHPSWKPDWFTMNEYETQKKTRQQLLIIIKPLFRIRTSLTLLYLSSPARLWI